MATTDHMTTVVDNVLETPRIQFEAADTSTHYHSAYFGGHSKSSSDDDSVDRRKRYLESNRAAANRCRQKKKEWVSNLETKANELEKINHKLEKEMRALKQEIHQLKLLLLEHKDCPAMMSNNLYIALVPQTQTIT
jgi:chromosome segregation ATPase